MAAWLLKTEPSTYSLDDLEREKTTVWDGIANAAALKHLRLMQKGESVFIYHTGDEKAVVGIASVACTAYQDPKSDDPKHAVIDVKFKERLPRPVTLKQIKAEPALSGWDLVRLPRLSVVPTSADIWKRINEMAGRPGV